MNLPALTCGPSETNKNSHRHWYGQTFQTVPARSYSMPSSRSDALTPLPPAQYHFHGRYYP